MMLRALQTEPILHHQKNINKNGLDLTKNDLKDFDVVDALGGWTLETIPNITNVMIHLASLLKGEKNKMNSC